MGAIDQHPGIRVAYLNTRYPSLSHTFIEREVRAVRAHGVEVHPFSVRRPSRHDTLDPIHQEASRETHYLVRGMVPLAAALAWAILSHPLGLCRALVRSQRLAPAGIRSRLLHLAYVLEAAELAREMKRRGLRHVHVHMANNGAAVALLACVLDPSLSYSLSIHGSAEFFRVDSWRLRPKADNATFVRCISEFCRAQVMAWTSPQRWERFHVVHCGIDVGVFRPRPAPGQGPLRIVTVGRLDPIKGYTVLLEACRRLSELQIDWRLDMVGDGELRQMLQQKARDLGIAGRVTFSGAVGQDRIQEHLDGADVMVVSSFMEGVPVVLMEAMAKELAVVATSVGGIPELVDDGINGLLITPGSAAALGDALARLARDRDLARRLGPPSRRRIVEEFAIDAVGFAMAALFREYLLPAAGRCSAGEPSAARAGARGSDAAPGGDEWGTNGLVKL